MINIPNPSSLQESLYGFPYHHLPRISNDGQIIIHKSLAWGLKYLTYISFLCDLISKREPKSICDVGCGDGRLLSMLGHVEKRVGVDTSSNAISFARAFAPDAEWLCCPIAQVPGKYDVVTCIETLEHIPENQVADFISSLKTRIAKGGILIVSVPTTNQAINAKHHRHYTEDLLRQHLAPHFRIQETAWLFKLGICTNMLNRLLTNRIFILQYPPALRLIWRMHQKFGFFASPSDGAHLIAVATALNENNEQLPMTA